MEPLTFDQLPQAISSIHEKLDAIKDLLKERSEESQNKEEILNISQAAALLNLSVPTIYGRVCRHQIPVYKQGKRLYFYKSELEDWIKSGKKKTMDELRQDVEERISGRSRKFKMRR
jgi:excisionase family DNA binding protein